MSGAQSLKRTVTKLVPRPVKQLAWRLAARPKRLQDAAHWQKALKGGRGIEIGGPSSVFKTILPLYEVIGALDGINFAGTTMWEGSIEEGHSFRFTDRRGVERVGRQFIAEASEIGVIADGAYDFLISSNCLEHVANPLKALHEWRRVVRSGGHFVLVLPHPQSNFDHRRPVTPFSHLVDDYLNETTEHDLTHLDEILRLHDLDRDRPAGDLASFERRSRQNFENRGLHHHVFDMNSIVDMCKHAGFEVLRTAESEQDYFALCRVS